jgi:ketosteroid isomerase-like protein
MPQENLTIVRRGIEAFNARDVDSFAAVVTDDFVWAPALSGAIGGGAYVGRAGIERYFRESAETWEQLTVEPQELREQGGVVAMLGRAVGRGVGSGVPVEMPLAFLAEFRGDRIAKVAAFPSHADALEAAGLD